MENIRKEKKCAQILKHRPISNSRLASITRTIDLPYSIDRIDDYFRGCSPSTSFETYYEVSVTMHRIISGHESRHEGYVSARRHTDGYVSWSSNVALNISPTSRNYCHQRHFFPIVLKIPFQSAGCLSFV